MNFPLRLPDALLSDARLEAERVGISLNGFVCSAVALYVRGLAIRPHGRPSTPPAVENAQEAAFLARQGHLPGLPAPAPAPPVRWTADAVLDGSLVFPAEVLSMILRRASDKGFDALEPAEKAAFLLHRYQQRDKPAAKPAKRRR